MLQKAQKFAQMFLKQVSNLMNDLRKPWVLEEKLASQVLLSRAYNECVCFHTFESRLQLLALICYLDLTWPVCLDQIKSG
jgi:hypothetical protein